MEFGLNMKEVLFKRKISRFNFMLMSSPKILQLLYVYQNESKIEIQKLNNRCNVNSNSQQLILYFKSS